MEEIKHVKIHSGIIVWYPISEEIHSALILLIKGHVHHVVAVRFDDVVQEAKQLRSIIKAADDREIELHDLIRLEKDELLIPSLKTVILIWD